MTLDGGNEEKEENDPDMPPLHVRNHELGQYVLWDGNDEEGGDWWG